MEKLSEILGLLIGSPTGVYAEELEKIDPEYKEALRELIKNEDAIFEKHQDPAEKVFYVLKNPEIIDDFLAKRKEEDKEESPTTPPDIQSPAETPPSETPQQKSEPTDFAGFNSAMFQITDFRLRSRKGNLPIMQMIPANQDSARMALDFSMNQKEETISNVYIEGQKLKDKSPPPEGGEQVVAPKDYGTIQIQNKKPAKKEQPEEKSKEQLSKEIDEQVQKGLISPETADGMAKLGDL